MKSEHRHELQTNELGKITEKLTGFMEVHGNRLMIGVCVASLVASAIIYWVRTRHNNEAAAWRELASAAASNKPEEFFDVWNAHPGSLTGAWARVHEGETRLGMGVQSLFRNVETGTEEVKKAKAAFQSVVDDRQSPPEVRERGLLGLARAHESLSETDDAVKVYETLVKKFKDTLYKNDAEQRIAILKKKSAQEFYVWFATYERPKPVEKRPHDKIGDELSEEEKALFDEFRKKGSAKSSGEDGEPLKLPDLTKPDDESDEKAPSKKGGDSESPEGDDAEPESKPESKPDDAKKPADDSKPDES